MKICQRIALTIAVVALLIVPTVYVAAKNARSSGQRATNVRIEMRDIYGPLFVTIGGTEKKITDCVQARRRTVEAKPFCICTPTDQVLDSLNVPGFFSLYQGGSPFLSKEHHSFAPLKIVRWIGWRSGNGD
jgi:hypothetical protein